MVRGFDNTVLGEQTVVATCKDHEFWFGITIIEEPKPIGIFVHSTKNTYYQGEELDLRDARLGIQYDNHSSKSFPITDLDVTVSGYDKNTIGGQMVTVQCLGLTTEFYVVVYAYTGKCGDNLYFEFDEDSGILSITGTGAMYDYNGMPWIPYADRIQRVELPHGLTNITTFAFDNCQSLTEIIIPSSVTYIGKHAFAGAGLTEVVLQEGLEIIDRRAFECCDLKKLVLPESLKILGGGAFQSCTELETVHIPENLETISWQTFMECYNLREITIPKSVTQIAYGAFAFCENLDTIRFEGAAPTTDVMNKNDLEDPYPSNTVEPFCNVTANAWYPGDDATWTDEAKISLGGNLTWWENGTNVYRVVLDAADGIVCEGNITRYVSGTPVGLPTAVAKYGYAFEGWYEGNKRVTQIPADATGDKTYVARWKRKPMLDIDITPQVFEYDGTGKQFVLKDTSGNILPVIENSNWLLPCSYTEVLSPFGERESPTTAGASTYHQGIDLAAPVGTPIFAARDGIVTTATYTNSAGYYVNIDHQDGYSSIYMHMSAYVVRSGQWVSQGALIGYVGQTGIATQHHLHFGIRWKDAYVDPAEYVDFENGATAFLIDYTWSGKTLNEDGLPCEPGMYDILILRPETEQYYEVRQNISNAIVIRDTEILTEGTCGNKLKWKFDEKTGALTISGNSSMYDFSEWTDNQGNHWTSAPWFDLREQITSVIIENGVIGIGANAFDGCSNLKTASIPESVAHINYGVFDSCTRLQSITVSAYNESYCDQNGILFTKDLTQLVKYPAQKQNTLYVIPDTVSYISAWAFEGNAWLKRVSIPEGIVTLGEGIFAECTALTEVTIPESVQWTSPYIFRNCTSLTKVVLPKSITWLGEYMFENCTSLKTIVISEEMGGIATGAFKGCSALEEIVLPEGLQELWTGAFQDCTSLKSITIPNSVNRSEGTIMRDYVFANCTALEQIIFAGQAPNFGDNAFEGVSATAIYPGNDVTWTAAKKQNYGGNLTWKPMLSSLELSRYPTPLIIGQGFRVMPRMIPSNAAANLTYTVSGNAELKDSKVSWFILGTAPGTATLTVTDSITGLTAELTLPVVKTINLTCPQVSAPFTLSEDYQPVFTFTPTETKQYSMTLENVQNTFNGYGEVSIIDVVDTMKHIDVSNDEFFWEEATSQGFYTLEQGVTYQITPSYYGNRELENVTLRISDVAEVTGIEILYDTITIWFDTDAGIIGDTIEAYFRPVQALGDITWTISDPQILSAESKGSNMCGFRALKTGTTVVTATCGDYSDSVTVTVKQLPKLTLNVPFRDTCDYQTGKTYVFTAPEAGNYRFSCSADLYVSSTNGWYEDSKESYTYLEAGESCAVHVLHTNQESSTATEYTILAEKMGIPVSMTLEPSISNDGRVTVQAVYRPVNSVEKFETVEWDNPDVVWASSKSGTRASAKIKGEGEVTVTVATENGLMASRTLAVGTCGRNLYWMFDEASGKLTIAGSGAMYDYDWEGTPWKEYCEKILSVELPDTMTALGAYAFNGCINLKELKLPEGISEIPDWALNRCMSLSDLYIPDSVKRIGDTALSECNGLTKLVLPEGMETIDGNAFSCNTGLKEIYLPVSLKSLGHNAFNTCTALEKVNIPQSLDIIDWSTFARCTSLKEITIPKSVTEIAYWAFTECTGLENIIFEGSAPSTNAEAGSAMEPFYELTAEAWYNGEDDSWTEEARMRIGSQLQWKPFGLTENRLMLNGDPFDGLEIVWIDGVEYAVQQDGENRYIDLPDGNAKIMTAYEYHVGDASDVHTQYPVSMKVWTLENDNGFYTATRQEDFDDILQYTGVSIRVTGKKGIRMITAMEEKKKADLTGSGLAGYTLKEYGTVIAWANQISESRPLVLGKSYVNSNYAYRKNVADPIFRYENGLIHYTNVLVNFSNEQCKNDIAMRPYMILEDQRGNEITIYGGIVERSIGYIAYMNRNAFKPDTDPYEYIWEIIHYVYGDIYDAEYVPSWTDEIK